MVYVYYRNAKVAKLRRGRCLVKWSVSRCEEGRYYVYATTYEEIQRLNMLVDDKAADSNILFSRSKTHQNK